MSYPIQNILCKVVFVPILCSLLSVLLSVVTATTSAVVVRVASLLFGTVKFIQKVCVIREIYLLLYGCEIPSLALNKKHTMK